MERKIKIIAKYFSTIGWKWGIPSMLKPGGWTWSLKSYKTRLGALRAGRRANP